jgi:hypothetical protein
MIVEKNKLVPLLHRLDELEHILKVNRFFHDVDQKTIRTLREALDIERKKNDQLTKEVKLLDHRLLRTWKKWKKLQYRHHTAADSSSWKDYYMKQKLAGYYKKPKLDLDSLTEFLYEIFYSQDPNPDGRKVLYYE